MAGNRAAAPPRPLEAGDIVITYSRYLGEWSAAQIIALGAEFHPDAVAVLELDWSGPQPTDTCQIEKAPPLRLTHHAHRGGLSYYNVDWVLPKSYLVVGNLPLRHTERSDSYVGSWRVGYQLALQRSWDRGEADFSDPAAVKCTGAELDELLTGPVQPEVLDLKVSDVEALDCVQFVRTFPMLEALSLAGALGTLHRAESLNRLAELKTLFIRDLFGMTEHDILDPAKLVRLEMLGLYSVPMDYARASRNVWSKQVPAGVSLEVRQPREPACVAENRDNPLRDWDGREHISSRAYSRSVKQFQLTCRAVLAAEAAGAESQAFEEIGRDFGTAFNALDKRRMFIETEEREELFKALRLLAEQYCSDAAGVTQALHAGVEAVRDW